MKNAPWPDDDDNNNSMVMEGDESHNNNGDDSSSRGSSIATTNMRGQPNAPKKKRGRKASLAGTRRTTGRDGIARCRLGRLVLTTALVSLGGTHFVHSARGNHKRGRHATVARLGGMDRIFHQELCDTKNNALYGFFVEQFYNFPRGSPWPF